MGGMALITGGAIVFCGWVTVSINARPTRGETIQLIKTNAPYNTDKSMILEAVKDSKQNSAALRDAIQANTQAIIELKVVLEHIKNER